jgi:hypothetical protein
MLIREESTTPYVKLDKENCRLTIIGKSYPEHPSLFYDPIVEEIDKCKSDLSKSKITIRIALEILNSVSTKYLFHLIKELYDSAMETEVDWYYEEDDESMLEEGNYLKSSFPKSNFNLMGVEDLREIWLN